MLWLTSFALAQSVPNGTFTAGFAPWVQTDVDPNSSAAIEHDNISQSNVLRIDRGQDDNDPAVVCSAPFTVTRRTLSARMRIQFDSEGSTDLWVASEGTGQTLASDQVRPADQYSYAIETLDITAACGEVVVACVEPETDHTCRYDDFLLSGNVCEDYQDGDGDGACPIGIDLNGDGACELPGEFDGAGFDCDDSDVALSSLQAEVCDGLDQDCDLVADNGLFFADFWPDVDGDGYGDDGALATSACEPPAGFADNALDCVDSNAAISPDAPDLAADGTDWNCDGFDGPGTTGPAGPSDSALSDRGPKNRVDRVGTADQVGCGCALGASPGVAPLMLLGLLGVSFRRRR